MHLELSLLEVFSDPLHPLMSRMGGVGDVEDIHSLLVLVLVCRRTLSPFPVSWVQVEDGLRLCVLLHLGRCQHQIDHAFAVRVGLGLEGLMLDVHSGCPRSCRCRWHAGLFVSPPDNLHVGHHEKSPIPSLETQGSGALFVHVTVDHRCLFNLQLLVARRRRRWCVTLRWACSQLVGLFSGCCWQWLLCRSWQHPRRGGLAQCRRCCCLSGP
mmetsp:Transcript_140104/g.349135  ORF Transcript_140104/g.349135 Transcript_140104/m.349135 type:complete len:212 (+) Transcript_140104:301-936(+)